MARPIVVNDAGFKKERVVRHRWETFMRERRSAERARLSLEPLEMRRVLAADVYISEFSASNEDVLLDEDGDTPDWIEIFNAGPDDVDLAGWHLTDNADELTKWSFPSQPLSAGSFLLVYASDKDRAEAGGPLHTNFKLKSGGEYLALTRSLAGDDVEVVSEFAPEFPFQFPDISYGVGQVVDEAVISSPTASAKLFVPQDDAWGRSWTTQEFSDSDWAGVTAGIGYQQTVPGFTVQDAKSRSRVQNLANAEAVLSGVGRSSQTTEIAPVVNFRDPGGGGGRGRFGGDVRFPNDRGGDDNDFAIRATGIVTIPTGGRWTFGINSDDGARLRINGANVINDDTLHAPQDTLGTTSLPAGDHELELIFFERAGGAEVELYAAPGRHSSFSSGEFSLVGDVENGGLEINTSASGATSTFSSLFTTDVSDSLLGVSSDAYLRIPFEVPEVSALATLSLRVHYDDGFIAYLNGTEVARRNAPPGPGTANSRAAVDRARVSAEVAETINLSPFFGLMRNGPNVLALHALNESLDSDEFLLQASLAEVSVETGDRLYFPTPTPGAFNPSTGVEGFLAHEIEFSHPHGFYSTAFPLALTAATSGTAIRYTLDGSEPTSTNGFDYTQPIMIEGTTTLRARAFKSGFDPSFVATGSFLFLDDILEQSRASAREAGFPSGNPNSQVLDFGMDPDIVDSPTWGPQLEAALTQVPSLSVVMDLDDLFDKRSGIYVNARSHGKEWERPASLELLDPEGVESFTVNAGIRIRGGFSRSGNNPKHAFRLFFREEYGDAKLYHPLFGEEGVEQFDKIDLRTTQNYSWAFQGGATNAFVRDVYSRDLQGALGQPYTRSRYYHLYINGHYWGLFQTQERAEARYAADYFGGNASDYDVVKSAGSSGGYENEATDGNLQAYQRLADYFYQSGGLGDRNHSDYLKVQGQNPDGSRNPSFERLLDVENLIDYMMITYFTSDADGPGSKFTRPRVNNYYGIFNRANPDGFKFFEHDSEHSLDEGNSAGANYNMVTPLTTGGSQFRYFNPHWMHEQLAKSNTEYRTQFMDRVTEHFFNDGLLTPEVGKRMIDARADQIDLAIIAESARWGDAKRGTPRTKNDWVNAVRRAKNFFDGRAEDVLDQLRSVDWYPEQDPPEFRVNRSPQHGGEVTPQDQISVATNTSFVFDRTLLSSGSTWKYLDNGSNQRTAWRKSSFNDSAWKSGPAQLGYGDADEATVVSFGENRSDKHVTTYFRRTFQVADPSANEGLRLRLLRDDGAVVYINGTEVARSNMPGGTIGYRTSAAAVAGGGSESTFHEYDIAPGLLTTGENLIAVEVHQHVGSSGNVTSSDVSFDLELLGGALVLADDVALFYTLDGSDPRMTGGQVSPAAIAYDPVAGIRLQTSAQVIVRTRIGGEWGPALAANFSVSGSDGVPVAQDDQFEGPENVVITGSVAENDTLSPDGGNQFRLLTATLQGEVILDPQGSFQYTPRPGFLGEDSFAYVLSDADGSTSIGQVNLLVTPISIAGDLNQDRELDTADVDALLAALRTGSQQATFDLNGDDEVNDLDLTFLIESIFKTRAGDVDLDGDVDFADFLVVANNFGREDSGWGSGNFDADESTGFPDFLILSAHFGFQRNEDADE